MVWSEPFQPVGIQRGQKDISTKIQSSISVENEMLGLHSAGKYGETFYGLTPARVKSNKIYNTTNETVRML